MANALISSFVALARRFGFADFEAGHRFAAGARHLGDQLVAEVDAPGGIGGDEMHCAYPAETDHAEHVTFIEEGDGIDDPSDDNPPALWLFWNGAGQRAVRWDISCPSEMPPTDDELYCVLPNGHPGVCNSGGYDEMASISFAP